ncbi:MAG TPA: DUF4231 domain-containing protein [Vicinamibacterales bacterium]|nr:DUF4231 domain-containing protein [Vicinamibacterales bacterium]
MSKLDHVRQEVDHARAFFSRKRAYNRARVLWLSLASASLSALATVAIGATKMLSLEWLQLVALVASAVATVVGVWESVFAYRKLWSINNVAMADLDRIKRLIDYRMTVAESVTEVEVDEFFKQFDQVMTNVDQAWVETYRSK